MRLSTAGESHGPAVAAVLEGVPAGLAVPAEAVDAFLALRQRGHGRGGRMRIERDRVEILAGLRGGRTLGNPLVLLVRNRDATLERLPPVTRPRPGHADLAGMLKMGTRDARDVLERASARSTAALAAAGAVASLLLRECGIEAAGYCASLGEVRAAVPDGDVASLRAARDASPFLCPDAGAAAAMTALVDGARAAGDTVGGVVEVRVEGVPPGLGDFRVPEARLDGRLAAALMRIPAVKGVEIGLGFEAARRPGSGAHDPILPARRGGFPRRSSNHAGGVEGGMSNGEPILVRAAMKPLSTLRRPLPSVDAVTGAEGTGATQRSDVCAVPACAIVAEAAVALEVAAALLEKTGGDTMAEVKRNLGAYLRAARRVFAAPRRSSSGGAARRR
ncbi:MAG: chorismate synthase [Planctomycetes bacterium]|nr:chorismate synthase [Planctomycetota bacterium]